MTKKNLEEKDFHADTKKVTMNFESSKTIDGDFQKDQ